MLEKSIKRDEDEEIVRVLRSLGLSHEELVQVLLGIKNGSIRVEDLKKRKEDRDKALGIVDNTSGNERAAGKDSSLRSE